MFHSPEEDGFAAYEPPTEAEIQIAGRGLVESYDGGGLRLVLEDYLELDGRIAENSDILLLLQRLAAVANHARLGSKYERAAMERIISKHWR